MRKRHGKEHSRQREQWVVSEVEPCVAQASLPPFHGEETENHRGHPFSEDLTGGKWKTSLTFENSI